MNVQKTSSKQGEITWKLALRFRDTVQCSRFHDAAVLMYCSIPNSKKRGLDLSHDYTYMPDAVDCGQKITDKGSTIHLRYLGHNSCQIERHIQCSVLTVFLDYFVHRFMSLAQLLSSHSNLYTASPSPSASTSAVPSTSSTSSCSPTSRSVFLLTRFRFWCVIHQ